MTPSVPPALPASPRRIGLFGGSFDPVHVGHRRLAECALEQLGLDELRWVVAGQPWQKARQLAPAEDRAAMVALAIAAEPRFRLERCELDRDGPSFTIDTVERLRAEEQGQGQAHSARSGEPPARWFLLIGQDQYANLTTWRRWRDLIGLVELAVAARDGQVPQPSAELAAVPHRLHRLAMPAVAVSSTALRKALAEAVAPSNLVPEGLDAGVANYLAARGLYHSTPARSG